MNATFELPRINWQLDDYPYFRSCGEITASPDLQTFGLNCRFCPGICLQLYEFMQHLKEQHLSDINNLYSVNVDQKAYEKIQELSEINKNRDNSVTVLDVDMLLLSESKKCDEKENKNTTNALATTSAFTIEMPTPLMPMTTMPSLLESPPVKVFNPNQFEFATTALSTAPTTTTTSAATTTATTPPPQTSSIESNDPDDLVYIIESSLPTELIAEVEQIIDPLQISKNQTHGQCNSNSNSNSNNPTSAVSPEPNLQSSANTTDAKKIEENLRKKYLQTKSKTNKAETTIIRQMEHNKEFINYLLEAYKNNEKLWNPSHSNYKYNARRSVFNELSEQIRKDLQLELTGNEVYLLVKSLRGRFSRELAKSKTAKNLWFFDKMLFLRDIIEKKRADRDLKILCDDTESEKSLDSSHSSLDSNKSNHNHERLSCLLYCFETAPALWNPEHSDYADYERKSVYEKIAAKLFNDYQIVLSPDECLKEMQKLLIRYRKELRILIQHKGLYLPKLWCFEQMEFLRPIYTEQILKRIDKKKGVVECSRKSNFLKASPICLQSLDEQYQFIEIYRNYPALWDIDHSDYRSANYRDKAYNEMLEELNVTLNLNATLDELQKTILDLRKEYSTAKLQKLSNSASSTTLLHKKLSEFLEDNIGPYRCNDCNELVKTADQFKIHKSGHDGIQPFLCPICGKGFQLPGNLTVHIRRHTHDFPFTCKQCHKSFATSTEVIVHMRTHTGERPYICDYCGKTFKTWSFFDIHRRIHLNQSTFHCPICDKGFYEKNRYTDHMNGHLNIRKHLCNVCGKSFTTYSNLKKHNELHLPIKKYKCKICQKRFAQFASLRWHKLRQHFDGICLNECDNKGRADF